MTNEEKAKEIANNNCTHICLADCSAESYFNSENDCYKVGMQMAEWKDEQPICELEGWHTEPPTKDGFYLVETPNFPKNCFFIIAEWDNDAKCFYDEATDNPIEFIKWKLVELK